MMYEIIISIILLIIIISIIYLTLTSFNNRKKIRKIYDALANYALINEINDFEIIYKKDNDYDFLCKFDDQFLLIKIIDNPNSNEIILNSRSKWQINKGGSKDYFVNDIESFLVLDTKKIKEENVFKIALIYPNSRNLMRYVNECELAFIYPNQEIYGCHLIRFLNLNQDLNEIIKI